MAWSNTLPSCRPAHWPPCERACSFTLHWPLRSVADSPAWLSGLAVPATASAPGAAALPSVPEPSHRLLALCGEAGLRRLVHRHMARLQLTPLLDQAGDCYECVVERVGDFVIERCGGPLLYSERHARLLAGAGGPVLLDAAGRDLWLVQLWHAFEDVGLPPRLQADFWHWAEPLSVHLMTPRARQTPPRRYPHAVVQAWFSHRPEPAGASGPGDAKAGGACDRPD